MAAVAYEMLDSAQDDSPQDVVNNIVSARKSWKTVRGSGEAVWPPILEEALVKALFHYQPGNSLSVSALGRSPKRNQFVSDFIFQETGIRRSPKQVGSRLQQLKDIHYGKRLLSRFTKRSNRIVSRHLPTPKRAWDATSLGALRAVSPTLQPLEYAPAGDAWYPWALPSELMPPSSPSAPPAAPCIDVVVAVDPLGLAWPLPNAAADAAGALLPLATFAGSLTAPASVYADADATPRPLWAAEPRVAFRAHHPVAAQSLARVLCDGRVVHTESHPLMCTPPPRAGTGSGFVYHAALAPQFWAALCQAPDITRYTIEQEIHCNLDTSEIERGQVILKIVYHFHCAPAALPLPAPAPADEFKFEASPDAFSMETVDPDANAWLEALAYASPHFFEAELRHVL